MSNRTIDQANALAERYLARALAVRAEPGPVATGCCLSCGEPIAPARRWCDAECRDDWQRRRDAARRAGAQ